MKSPVGIIFIVALLVMFVGCGQAVDKSAQHRKPLTEKELIQINRRLMRSEKEEINRFIRKKGWKMNVTPTGLRYMIIKQGHGPNARKGKVAVIRYTIRLLDGRIVASSDKNGLKSFEIGHGGVEKGLEEGILLLKVGDKAKFILPSHLAYGLSGDGLFIPPQSPLVYDVEFVQLN